MGKAPILGNAPQEEQATVRDTWEIVFKIGNSAMEDRELQFVQETDRDPELKDSWDILEKEPNVTRELQSVHPMETELETEVKLM